MTWSYDSAMPTDKDKVRFLIQDTVTANQLLQDEEINFVLSTTQPYTMAASSCAEVLSTKFASMAEEKQIGNLKLKYADRSKKYALLSTKLATSSAKYVLPYSGGISVADKETNEADVDRVSPSIKRRAMDNLYSSGVTGGE